MISFTNKIDQVLQNFEKILSSNQKQELQTIIKRTNARLEEFARNMATVIEDMILQKDYSATEQKLESFNECIQKIPEEQGKVTK